MIIGARPKCLASNLTGGIVALHRAIRRA